MEHNENNKTALNIEEEKAINPNASICTLLTIYLNSEWRRRETENSYARH